MKHRLDVNGESREVDVPQGTTLLEALRDDLGLVAARYGCGRGQCGACFVLADGRAVASCLISVGQAEVHRIVTVEGLVSAGWDAVQRAFVEEDAMQCGYCTSGMLISAAGLLARQRSPTDDEIRDALEAESVPLRRAAPRRACRPARGGDAVPALLSWSAGRSTGRS
ncbi:hypothetical protein BH18CHL2_BH18CHL2_08590 [soil metagenome]